MTADELRIDERGKGGAQFDLAALFEHTKSPTLLLPKQGLELAARPHPKMTNCHDQSRCLSTTSSDRRPCCSVSGEFVSGYRDDLGGPTPEATHISRNGGVHW